VIPISRVDQWREMALQIVAPEFEPDEHVEAALVYAETERRPSLGSGQLDPALRGLERALSLKNHPLVLTDRRLFVLEGARVSMKPSALVTALPRDKIVRVERRRHPVHDVLSLDLGDAGNWSLKVHRDARAQLDELVTALGG
jgi:hypothetical protein